MNCEARYRVYNRCKYDIGVRLTNGMTMSIKPGSFQILTVNDILFVESICTGKKFFSQKMLVTVDDNGKEIPFNELGIAVDDNAQPHYSDAEIEAALKQSAKKMEAWLEEVTDPVELHAIYNVAKNIDLPASKLKILSAKMPSKDMLDEA